MIWLWLILTYIVLFYIREYRIRMKSPPGPWPLPIVGNLHQIGLASEKPHIGVYEVAKRYQGGITRFKFGSMETVVVSSYQTAKEVLCHPDALGRLLDGLLYDRNRGQKIGLLFSEGELWEKKRMWTFKTLREFGFSKSHLMETITNEMIDIFLNDIDKNLSSGVDIINMEEAFTHPTFRIMWKMIAGRLTPEEDKGVIPRMLEKSARMARAGNMGAGVVSVFPFVKYLLPEWSGSNAIMELVKECRKAAKELFVEMQHNIKGTKEAPQNLAEAYVKMAKLDQDDFNEEDFEFVFLDLLQASSDTVSSFLESMVLYLILNPEKQAKVHKDIMDYIPAGQKPKYQDLKKMIYTQAFMAEVHRCTKVVQHFIPRRATKDFTYKSFLIRENTTIIADVHGIFNDTKMFGNDTDVFKPERFIRSDGQLTESYKNVIPFSVGRRMCPGVSYAEVVSFLFFTNILKKYKLSPAPGKPDPKTEMNVGFTSRPFPYYISIKSRV